ncbi:hypothetical protein CBL_08502 [Carabus blaptoides fortunei]
MRLDKIKALHQSLKSQQAVFTKLRGDNENVIQTSYVVGELIARRLRPHVEGEFVKEGMVAAAELIAPDKVKLFQNVSLSRRTISDRITDLAQDIKNTLKGSAEDFHFFFLACDETTDITNTAQLAVFKLELTFEKLSGLTTDGAPAMVGSQKGLIAFVKKEMNRLSLDPSDLIKCPCIIHQESLCAQSLRLDNV